VAERCVIETGEAAGTFVLRGELSFSTVTSLMQQSAQLLWQADQLTLDLDGVTRTDSAGLALLIEWLRIARHKGKTIQFRNIPRQLMAVAEVVGLDRLLPVAA
jgi:phospholipid transport system transporter-binding protein